MDPSALSRYCTPMARHTEAAMSQGLNGLRLAVSSLSTSVTRREHSSKLWPGCSSSSEATKLLTVTCANVTVLGGSAFCASNSGKLATCHNAYPDHVRLNSCALLPRAAASVLLCPLLACRSPRELGCALFVQRVRSGEFNHVSS